MQKGPKHSTPARLVSTRHCNSANPCPRCALLTVVRYRFSAFRAQFGREPTPVEPLFFNPLKRVPVKASLQEARAQIEEAAAAGGIDAGPVIRFLKLDSAIVQQEVDGAGHHPGQALAKPGKSWRARGNYNRPKTTPAWERFATNERLHRIHAITRQELKMISGVALMGQVRNSRDFLHILSLIRQSSRALGGVDDRPISGSKGPDRRSNP
jgi:hypothetical protein